MKKEQIVEIDNVQYTITVEHIGVWWVSICPAMENCSGCAKSEKESIENLLVCMYSYLAFL